MGRDASMTKKRKRSTRQDELSSSSESSADDEAPPYETTPPRRGSEARNNTSKYDVIITMLVGLQRGLADLQRSHHKLSRDVKKLSLSLREPHNNGSGDGDSSAQRSPISNQVQAARYELVFTSGKIGVPFDNGKKKEEYKIDMGQTIDTTVALVDHTDSDKPVENGRLASVRVEFCVLDDNAFNQHVHQSSYWSIEEFERCIKTTTKNQYPAQRKSVKVTNSQFNLINGVGSQSCSINMNSGNSKFRLAVRVVSSTQERVLEGFSNPFYVRDLVKRHKQRLNTATIGNTTHTLPAEPSTSVMLEQEQRDSTIQDHAVSPSLSAKSSTGQEQRDSTIQDHAVSPSLSAEPSTGVMLEQEQRDSTIQDHAVSPSLSAEPSTGVMLEQEQRALTIQDHAVSPLPSAPHVVSRISMTGQNELHAKDGPTQGFNPAAATLQFPRDTSAEARVIDNLGSSVSMDLATGALGLLPSKLLELLKEEYKLKEKVKLQVQSLSGELRCMHSVLREVAAVPWDQLNEQVKIWAREVREASYDIEDILDTFLVRVQGHQQADLSKLIQGMKKMRDLFSKGMARHITKQVQQMTERRVRYRVDDLVAKPAATKSIDPRLSTLYTKGSLLVGIEEPRDEVIKMLTPVAEDMEPKIVSIVGVGGLGKTTLAKAVYEKLSQDVHFKAFVPVGRNPDLNTVLRDILIDLNKQRYTTEFNLAILNEKQLIDELLEFLKDKRYFIVIDDIWDVPSWNIIRCALDNNNMRSRIVITTRRHDVAQKAGCSYYIEPLPYQRSKELFYGRIFGSEQKCPEKFVEISEEIIKKCGGVPLAIITTSSLLANKLGNINEWYEFCKSIGSGLGSSPDMEN